MIMQRRSFLVSVVLHLVILGLLFSGAGCVQPMEYLYVSLEETPGVEIFREERSNLRHLQLFSRRYPTGYALDRENYRLTFRVEIEKFAPHIWIDSTNPDGISLFLKSRPDLSPGYDRLRPCGTFSTSLPADELRFDWVICDASAAPDEMLISFDVEDASGKVLGTESLPFKIKNNGFYLPPDGP